MIGRLKQANCLLKELQNDVSHCNDVPHPSREIFLTKINYAERLLESIIHDVSNDTVRITLPTVGTC